MDINKEHYEQFRDAVILKCNGSKGRLYVTDAQAEDSFIEHVGEQYRKLLGASLRELGKLAYIKIDPEPRIVSIFSFLEAVDLPEAWARAAKALAEEVEQSSIVCPLITVNQVLGVKTGLYIELLPSGRLEESIVGAAKRSYSDLENLLNLIPLSVIERATEIAREERNIPSLHYLVRLLIAARKWRDYKSPLVLWYYSVAAPAGHYKLKNSKANNLIERARQDLFPTTKFPRNPIKRVFGWKEIEQLSQKLCDTLPKGYICDGILCVSRGGLVPTHIIAQILDVKTIKVICLASYENTEKTGLKVIGEPPRLPEEGKNWLVVDDIADTGETMEHIKDMFPNARRVALVCKDYSPAKKVIHKSATTLPPFVWAVFPWERE